MKLIFATQNQYKLEEIRNKLANNMEVISLSELQFQDEIPENGDSLEENALEKARYIYNLFHEATIADDTGLEVDILNGAPGIFSARYAGEQKNSKDNVQKLLKNLHGQNNRKAQFRTVIAFILNDKEFLFEGKVKGLIIEKEKGAEGFGYDPVFVPDGYSKTFAEMSLKEKNLISHRARAFEKLLTYLNANF